MQTLNHIHVASGETCRNAFNGTFRETETARRDEVSVHADSRVSQSDTECSNRAGRYNSILLPFRFVYHPEYDFQFGSHVFESAKYGLVRQQLLADGLAAEQDFVQPELALDEDLARVHTKEWVRRLRAGLLTLEEER